MYQAYVTEILPSPTRLLISNVEFLHEVANLHGHGITTVVSLGFNLELEQHGIRYKHYKDMLDSEDEVILHLFPEVVAYIDESLKRGPVLVHCAAGRSRSASFIVAYIMKTRAMTAREALSFVQQRHSIAQPNPFFYQQLEVYETLRWEVNMNHAAAQGVRMVALRARGNTETSLYNPDPVQQPVVDGAVRCRMCRRVLALPDQIVAHKQGGGGECTSFFVEPFDWMALGHATLGKLVCPNAKCTTKVGNFNWAGHPCSCGAWVAPAFAMHKKSVDVVQTNPILRPRTSVTNTETAPSS